MRGIVQRTGAVRPEAGREVERAYRDVRRLRGMRITILPHADNRMEEFGITVADVYRVVGQPDEEGEANMGRLYAQKTVGGRRIRVIYNWGAGDERIVVTVMLRRREGGRS